VKLADTLRFTTTGTIAGIARGLPQGRTDSLILFSRRSGVVDVADAA
jgi:hypothetical protein